MRKIFSILLFIIFSASAAFAFSSTIDPLDIGVGTRALGMGKAYVAAADDVNSIFLNPAGLANTHGWGLTSNYSTHFEEVTYMTLGAFRSTSQEGFGIGYVGANVGGDILITYRDPITQRIVPGDVVAAGYSSNVLLLSYGVLLGKYYDFPCSDKISFGMNMKLFYQSLKSSDEAVATGQDLDLGLIYRHNDWLRFGFYGQNVLPNASGGLLIWNSGAQEAIPANYKLGASFKAFGEKAYWDYTQDVYFNLDLEDGFEADRPTVYHLGTEWWLYKYLALRVGLDQDVYAKSSGNGVDNNMTFGLGFWYGDYGFDYAYHPYGSLPENITHYFSLSYGFPIQEAAAPTYKPLAEQPAVPSTAKAAPKEFLLIEELYDKYSTFRDSIDVNGTILDPSIAKIDINGNEAAILRISGSDRALFSYTLTLPKYGKVPVAVRCYDAGGELIREYKFRVMHKPAFSDIPPTFWAKTSIDSLASLSMIGGLPNGTFQPNKPVNRAEMTSILVKAMDVDVPDVKVSPFKDMDKKNWAAKFISVGVDRGIVSGYRDGTFKPGKVLNRAEGLTMIMKFAGIKPDVTVREKPYPDVPASHWAAKTIAAAKTEGLLDFLAGKKFEPAKQFTRAEAAQILSKTNIIKQKLLDLDNWETGF